jgi:valacyclovir hydrolase
MRDRMVEKYGDEYVRKTWSGWVDAFAGIYADGGDICKDDLQKIQCPTLIIHGKQDPSVGIEQPENLHQNIKNSVYEGYIKYSCRTQISHISLSWYM